MSSFSPLREKNQDEMRKYSVKDLLINVHETTNGVTTTVKGRDGNQKILRYDMKALVRKTAIYSMFSEGTVFTMDNAASLNVLLMLTVGACACGLSCAVAAGIGRWDNLADLNVTPLENLSTQISAFVPFCLALYISLTLTRWWTLRVAALGKVFDSFANISMIIACELNDKKWDAVRIQVAKYGFASVELLVQAARKREDLASLSTYLSDFENRALARQEELWQRPMIMWAWIMRICMGAMDHHKSPPPRTAAVMAQCMAAREGMATINTYLDTQLPFAYVHLITLLVNVQNIVLSVKCGIIFATAIPGQNVFVMVQQVIMLCIVCFIYQAILQISYMILDPFGDDVLDFPIMAYTNYLKVTIDAMYEAQAMCPVVAEDGSLHAPRDHVKDKPWT